MGVILTAYLLSAVLLILFEGNLLYHPSAETKHTFHTEIYSIDNETLNVIVINSGMPKAIIYFGGNAEAVVGNGINFTRIFPDHTVYLTNYRGFGGSSGTPREAELYSDAEYIYDRVANKHQQISIIGRSLGTGVATYIAAKRPVEKMVLVTPYDSIVSIAQDNYPLYPLSLLMRDQYNSADRISEITCPTLVILADNDLVIPAKYSSQLLSQFPAEQVNVETIKDSTHSNIVEKDRYLSLLAGYL